MGVAPDFRAPVRQRIATIRWRRRRRWSAMPTGNNIWAVRRIFQKSKLTIDKHEYPVIGVLPAGFRFPSETSIWIPRELDERNPSRTAHNWRVIGRLRDGASVQQARADVSSIAKHLKQQYGKDIWMADASVIPLQEAMVGKFVQHYCYLLGAVGFLLLVACANVANLMLVQAASRVTRTGDSRGAWRRTQPAGTSISNGGVAAFGCGRDAWEFLARCGEWMHC